MKRRWAGLAVTALASLTAAGCRCDDGFCDLATRPVRAEQITQGIAGVVTYRSDVVENGCQTCQPGLGRLHIWRTPALITTAAEASAVLLATSPQASLAVTNRFEQALDVGTYLACALPGVCASFEVLPGRVTTLHVRRVYGPTDLDLFDSDGRARRDHVFPHNGPEPNVSIQLGGVGHFAGPTARVNVRQPDGAGNGGMTITIQGSRAGRTLSLRVEQLDVWPPHPRFDLAFGRDNPNSLSEAQDGQAGGLASSGHLELALSEERLSGSFAAEMVQDGRSWSLQGSLSGAWALDCWTLSPRGNPGQPSWSPDPTRTSAFCAQVAEQAGVSRR